MSFWALVIQSHVLEFWKGSSQLLQVNVSGFQLLLRKCFGSSRVHGPRFQFQMHLRSEAAAASLLLEHWGLWGWCAATKMEKENALPHYECHQFIVTWNCLDPFFPYLWACLHLFGRWYRAGAWGRPASKQQTRKRAALLEARRKETKVKPPICLIFFRLVEFLTQ